MKWHAYVNSSAFLSLPFNVHWSCSPTARTFLCPFVMGDGLHVAKELLFVHKETQIEWMLKLITHCVRITHRVLIRMHSQVMSVSDWKQGWRRKTSMTMVAGERRDDDVRPEIRPQANEDVVWLIVPPAILWLLVRPSTMWTKRSLNTTIAGQRRVDATTTTTRG